jgi:hypothetical protein
MTTSVGGFNAHYSIGIENFIGKNIDIGIGIGKGIGIGEGGCVRCGCGYLVCVGGV